MSKRRCIIIGCERPHHARGWCTMHWQRMHRLGTTTCPNPAPRGLTPYERVMRRTMWVGECLEYTGTRQRDGYGVTKVEGRVKKAATVVMEHHHGPSDLWVLHACDNPPCVNIDHLRYGTASDNLQDCWDRGRRSQS